MGSFREGRRWAQAGRGAVFDGDKIRSSLWGFSSSFTGLREEMKALWEWCTDDLCLSLKVFHQRR